MNSLQTTNQNVQNVLPALKTGIDSYDHYIDQFRLHLTENNILLNIESVRNFIEASKLTYGISTVNVIKVSIARYLKEIAPTDDRYFAVIAKLQDSMKSIKVGKQNKKVEKDFLPTKDDIKKLIKGGVIIDSRKKEKNKSRFKFTTREQIIFETLYKTGLRIFELITIKKKDCKANGKFVNIFLVGKGSKERNIQFPYSLYQKIDSEFQGKEFLFEDSYFLPSPEHIEKHNLDQVGIKKQYVQNYRLYVKNRLAYYSRKLIGKRITPHGFRHYFATNCLKRGFSIKAIANWLGHSTTAITNDMYIHDELDSSKLFKI